MPSRLIKTFALAAFLPGCASAAPPAAQSSPTAAAAAERVADAIQQPSSGTFEARILARHNQHRAAVAVPPLQWDPQLAAGAQLHAAQLAAQERLAHSSRAGRPGISENLWRGHKKAYSPEAMVEYWADERAMFRAGIFPDVSTTGDWNDISHYSTMIWRTTTHVGCALQNSQRWDYLVCRYSPAGNKDGKPVP